MMNWRRHSISGAFVFLLLGVFAVFSMLLTVLGAQAYREIIDESSSHTRERIMHTFVRNAVRAQDEADAVSVEEYDGVPVLAIHSDIDGEGYTQYIYCWQGELRELFTSARYAFEPEDGTPICEAEGFEAVLENGLLTARMTDAEGTVSTAYIACRSVQ